MNGNGNKLPEPRVFSPADHPEPTSATNFSLARDEWGQLVLTSAGNSQPIAVTPTALFPISDPEKWISLRGPDGIEQACVEDPNSLSAETRELLRDELARQEFVPVIERIVRVSGTMEPSEWTVETDRGPTSFVLESEDDVRRIGDNQIVIVDAHGTRYHIPDLNAVDAKSRRIVEWYV
ncbi:MAG TPA: DUF1854 domain-containing protein [Lacipirellulaceae bacterium]|jgi:hypothetical protein|nr:DUF1854 domain-containing protein [Lacipirellulaceae bacterium]